jgi:F0F1-type ATP synthase assembly protein I
VSGLSWLPGGSTPHRALGAHMAAATVLRHRKQRAIASRAGDFLAGVAIGIVFTLFAMVSL